MAAFRLLEVSSPDKVDNSCFFSHFAEQSFCLTQIECTTRLFLHAAQAPAFFWLTGWPQEDINHPISGVPLEVRTHKCIFSNVKPWTRFSCLLLQGGARFDRLQQTVRPDPSREREQTIAVCCLKQHAASERALPRLVVFCGPSAVGKGKLMGLLEERLGDSFARTISHTVGPQLKHAAFPAEFSSVKCRSCA